MKMIKWSLSCLLLLLSACTDFPPDEAAVQITQAYYEALSQGDRVRALAYISSDQRPGLWRDKLQRAQAVLGAPEAFRLKALTTNSPYRGRFYTLDYSVRYGDGVVAAETVTLYSRGDDARLVIVDHRIAAQGFSM